MKVRLQITRKLRETTTVEVELDDVLATNLFRYAPSAAGAVLRQTVMPGLSDLTWTPSPTGLPEYELDSIHEIVEPEHVVSPDGNFRATPAETEGGLKVWGAAYMAGGEWRTVSKGGQPMVFDNVDDALARAARAKEAHGYG